MEDNDGLSFLMIVCVIAGTFLVGQAAGSQNTIRQMQKNMTPMQVQIAINVGVKDDGTISFYSSSER